MKARFRLFLITVCALGLAFQDAGALPTNGPHAAARWSPPNPERGQEVIFTIDAENSDGAIKSVWIDFGDGANQQFDSSDSVISNSRECLTGSRQEFSVPHTYSKEGSFGLTIEVESSPCLATGALEATHAEKKYSVHIAKPSSGKQGTDSASSSPQNGSGNSSQDSRGT